MMNFRFTDYPHEVPLSAYETALASMSQRLIDSGAVITVYQSGGVSNPGISDLDMIAVFKNDLKVDRNFLDGLSQVERYLFIHNLYGVSENNFGEAQIYAFYYNYKFLSGQELTVDSINKSPHQLLKRQVALEFLLKFFITLELQKAYGVIRLRDLLLHIKALQYDLEFLGIKDGTVYECVTEVLQWRTNWFNVHPAESYINKWMSRFYPALSDLMVHAFGDHSFYLPSQPAYRISKNIQLVPSSGKAMMVRKGFLLPAQLSSFGKKYFRLQNRLNSFDVRVPIHTDNIPDVLGKKFQYEKKIIDYNKKFLPYFLPLTSSLHAL